MSDQLEVVGVYRIKAREPVHLVEIQLTGVNGEFDFAEFTQEILDQPSSNWQVPYDEKILDRWGSIVKADPFMDRIPPEDFHGDMRIAFFFHYLDPKLPLKTPFGDVMLPKVTRRPRRLKFLKYEPSF